MKLINNKVFKRAGITIGTAAIVIAGAAAFSAFEAHVINVTARIENALSVDTKSIEFGTVFPQEYLTSDVNIGLSDSFIAEPRVDDVNYTIKQKPKVKDPICIDSQVVNNCNLNPTPGDPYATITVGNFTGPAWQYCENNLPPDSNLTDNIGYTVNLADPYWQNCYLPLANDLSKHELTTDGTEQENDTSINAFHQAYLWTLGVSSLNPAFLAKGRLVRSAQDTSDTWTIDLMVPCFVNQCAQEASDPQNIIGDDGIPGFYVPNEFRLDPATEHFVFGTDLWIEVTEISESEQTQRPTVGVNDTYVAPALGDCDTTVDDTGEFATIQAAVDDASEGDVICVEPGTYNENVLIDVDSLTVVSTGGPGTTTINGVVEIQVSGVTVRGFTITGAASSAPDFSGIYIWGSTSFQEISDNVIDGTDAASSRGILFGADVDDTTVSNNVIRDWTTGVYVNPTAAAGGLTFELNDFLSNVVGIGSDGMNNTEVMKNHFEDNTAEAIGMSDVAGGVTGIVINTNNFAPGGVSSGNEVNAYESTASISLVDATGNWWDGDIEANRTNDPTNVDTSSPEAIAFTHN